MRAINQTLRWFFASTVVLLNIYSNAYAHHAFAAEFDANSPVKLVGQVVKVEWINPHAWIHININGEKSDIGKSRESSELESTQIWMIEGGTPNTLIRAGINKNTIQPGTEVIVRGFQAKDKRCRPACKANGRDITLMNGAKLFMGSSGTGAPRDGSDPREPKR